MFGASILKFSLTMSFSKLYMCIYKIDVYVFFVFYVCTECTCYIKSVYLLFCLSFKMVWFVCFYMFAGLKYIYLYFITLNYTTIRMRNDDDDFKWYTPKWHGVIFSYRQPSQLLLLWWIHFVKVQPNQINFISTGFFFLCYFTLILMNPFW